jgi:hypothetical protein
MRAMFLTVVPEGSEEVVSVNHARLVHVQVAHANEENS